MVKSCGKAAGNSNKLLLATHQTKISTSPILLVVYCGEFSVVATSVKICNK